MAYLYTDSDDDAGDRNDDYAVFYDYTQRTKIAMVKNPHSGISRDEIVIINTVSYRVVDVVHDIANNTVKYYIHPKQ